MAEIILWIVQRPVRWLFGAFFLWHVIHLALSPDPWGAAWREATATAVGWSVVGVFVLVLLVLFPIGLWCWDMKDHGWEAAKRVPPTPTRIWAYWKHIWTEIRQIRRHGTE